MVQCALFRGALFAILVLPLQSLNVSSMGRIWSSILVRRTRGDITCDWLGLAAASSCLFFFLSRMHSQLLERSDSYCGAPQLSLSLPGRASCDFQNAKPRLVNSYSLPLLN